MKAFKKNTEKAKLNIKNNKNTYIKKVSIVLSCVILIVAVMFFTFAYFISNQEYTLIHTKVPEYTRDANVMAIYIDGTLVDRAPEKDTGYAFDRAECDGGGSARWDNDEWLLRMSLTQKTRCSVYFVTSN